MCSNLEGSYGSGLIPYSAHWEYKLRKQKQPTFTLSPTILTAVQATRMNSGYDVAYRVTSVSKMQ